MQGQQALVKQPPSNGPGVARLPKRPELPGKEKGGIAVKAGHDKTDNGHRAHHGVIQI